MLEVGDDFLRAKGRREQTRVRRDDQIVRKAALQSDAGHAERAVLVVRAGVLHVVRGLRDAPWSARRLRVLDLAADHRVVGFTQQRPRIAAHDEQRHEVLEHRRAPRHERAVRPDRRHEPPELEPVLLRHMPHGDGDEAGEPRFRREGVVVGRVAPPFGHVVADREQVPLAIEEKVELGRVHELLQRDGDARSRGSQRWFGRRPPIAETPPDRRAARESSMRPRRATSRRQPPFASPSRQPMLRVVQPGAEHRDFRRHRSKPVVACRSRHPASRRRRRESGARLRGNRARCRGRELATTGRGVALEQIEDVRQDHPESGDRSSTSASAIDGSALVIVIR